MAGDRSPETENKSIFQSFKKFSSARLWQRVFETVFNWETKQSYKVVALQEVAAYAKGSLWLHTLMIYVEQHQSWSLK